MPRYAKPITEQELKDYLLSKSREINEIDEIDEDEDEYNDIDLDVLADLTLCKDWKVRFSRENEVSFEFYQMNGFAIALWCCGGDCESPVYFAMYIDDKGKLRAYIPTYGNVFNIYTETAFGSERFRVNDPMPDTMPKELRDDVAEYKKYIAEVRNSSSIDKILADIAARICVRGNDTIPLPNGIKFPYYKGIKPGQVKKQN